MTLTMEWIELDETLLAEAFQERECAELLALRSSADPVPGICRGIAARIRAAVQANGRCVLDGSESSIPQALRSEAVALLRLKILIRYNLNVSDDRRQDAQKADERLDAIARGDMPFAGDSTPAARPAYYGRKRTRRQPPNGGIM